MMKHKSGRVVIIRKKRGTYALRLLLRKNVACIFDEDIRPVAFLVDYTSKITAVVNPRRGRWTTEALDTAKRGVLRHI